MKNSAGISTLNRQKIFRELPDQVFDLLIIGGGIMGAGIALDAAARGLKVLLVEKQDFAAGTSSRSTKLIHGGLRYLKNLECLLVRAVARERQVLHRNAPHLVVPEPMLIPVLKQHSFGYLATAAGLTLYEWLGNVPSAERHRMLHVKGTLQLEPLLNPSGLKGSGLFYEYRTDDARLTLEVMKTAQNYGATCLNYSALTELSFTGNKVNGGLIQDVRTGVTFQVKAKCVINAAGPWSGQVMQQDQVPGGPVLYHTKGVHLVVPHERLPLRQSVYFDIPGGRMLFAIPRHQITYLGTTDTPFSGDLEDPLTTKEDVKYLLEQINAMFPEVNLKPEDVESSWAGIRPLIYEEGKKPSQISRKDEIYTSGSGLITVAGGKLTGYRKLAEQVVNKAVSRHFEGRAGTSPTHNLKLSGGDFFSPLEVKKYLKQSQEKADQNGLPANQLPYLVRTYGSNTEAIVDQAILLKTTGAAGSNYLLQAEVWYTIMFEGALTISDFLIRRTGKLYFQRPEIRSLLPEISLTFQQNLRLTAEELENQKEEFNRHYEAAIAFKSAPANPFETPSHPPIEK